MKRNKRYAVVGSVMWKKMMDDRDKLGAYSGNEKKWKELFKKERKHLLRKGKKNH